MIEALYELIEEKYFSSGDFNGMPIYGLGGSFDIKSDAFKSSVRQAIEDEILTARSDGNPHIKAFSKIPKDKVLESFDASDFPGHICLYPHENKLANSELLKEYSESPYKLELAKGAGQLDFRTFDLSVLEYYRNDPRYSYETDFIHGRICIRDEFFETETVPGHDQILLQTFGFAYDDDLNRYAAVFLRYLSSLSPEHQKVWAAKEIKGNMQLHPDYYATSILGSWDTRMSIFVAFVEELHVINEMCGIIGKPSLFRYSYRDDRPKEFGFLLRPTESEFNNFILVWSKNSTLPFQGNLPNKLRTRSRLSFPCPIPVWSKNSCHLTGVEFQENTKPFSLSKRFYVPALFTMSPDAPFTLHRSRRTVFEEWREHSLIVVFVIPKFLKFVHKILPCMARDGRF